MSVLDLCKPMSVYFVLTPNTPVLCVSSAIITSIKDLNMFFTKCSADKTKMTSSQCSFWVAIDLIKAVYPFIVYISIL